MARKKRARTGRPPRHEGQRLSKNRTFRVRDSLDDKLQAAADESGRSVSEEIELRLERSFLRDNWTFLMREHIDHAAYAAAEKVKVNLEQLVKDIVREKAGPTTPADIGKPRKPEGEDKS